MANHDLDDDILGRAYDARLMRRLWAFTRPHVRLVLATCALFPAVTLLELIQPYLVKIAIDEHILRRDWAGLGWIAALFLLVLLVLYGLRAAQFYLTQITGQRVVGDLRAALFAHLQRQDARFFDRNPVGRLMTRILNDGEAIQELFTSGLVSLVGDVLTLTGVVVIMLGMDWRLALVTFALVPVLALAAGYFRLRARDSYRIVRARLARLNAFLQETLQGMTVIQLFAREARERRTFEDLSGALRRGQFRSTFYDASLYATVEALGSAAVALLLWYGGGQVVTGALISGNDVGMAMRYLEMPPAARWAAGLLALALIPLVALWVGRRLMQFAPDETRGSARARSHRTGRGWSPRPRARRRAARACRPPAAPRAPGARGAASPGAPATSRPPRRGTACRRRRASSGRPSRGRRR